MLRLLAIWAFIACALAKETCEEMNDADEIITILTCPLRCCGTWVFRFCCTESGDPYPNFPPRTTVAPVSSTANMTTGRTATTTATRVMGVTPSCIIEPAGIQLLCDYECCGPPENVTCCPQPKLDNDLINRATYLATAYIIAIVIGCVATIGILITIIVYCCCCRNTSTRKRGMYSSPNMYGARNPGYATPASIPPPSIQGNPKSFTTNPQGYNQPQEPVDEITVDPTYVTM